MWLKVYIRYKTIFPHEVAIDMQFVDFFIWRKNNVLFLRYLKFCVFAKSANFKILDIIIGIGS